MIIEKFIENGINYIRETRLNGTILEYPDPDFFIFPDPPLLPTPNLSTIDKKLDFIIKQMHLLDPFQP